MSIKIRLARTGKKNSPAFRVVVSQTRAKRNGRFLAVLGCFNPAMGEKPAIDTKAVEEWVKKGALLTEPVKKMLNGKYSYKRYDPKGEKISAEAKNHRENELGDVVLSTTPAENDTDSRKKE